MDIEDLRNVSHFAETIAARVWNEWWRNSDISLIEFQSGIEEMTRTTGIPSALVARQNKEYIGSVLLIENDLDARPQYSPWIAALWVEPKFRRRGVGGELLQAARQEAKSLGHDDCYLCATDANSPFYVDREFRLLESSVEGVNIFVI